MRLCLVQALAKPLQLRIHRFDLGQIDELIRIVALVKQLLTPIPFIADVNIIAFGHGNEGAPMSRRSTSARIGRIGDRQLRDRSITTANTVDGF